ncbi:MAG: endolytic transglycosylase MltG [Rhodobacteraceae bacterium]|nr:endolytic transglycosylase MltG [Paracoccaceae bacterium]
MWRSVASNALTLLVVVLAGIGVAVAAARATYQAEGPLAEAICLSVPRGATMRTVSEDLGAKGAVKFPALLRVGAGYEEKAQALKAGNFLIPPKASMAQMVDLITRSGQSTCGSEIILRVGVAETDIRVRELDPATGQYDEIADFDQAGPEPAAYTDLLAQGFARTRVTVVEGVTSWQVTEAVNKAGFLSGAPVDTQPEGSLAPGSYDVANGSSRDELITRMRNEQEAILTAAWAGRADGLPIVSAEEALILASIVEKETGIAEERPWVASVFINRLDQGMKLQTDPAVIYGITNGEGILGRGLRRSELARRTPYNTYVIDGLPPTPIANPGRAAIEAAVNPAQTEFLFFVADGTGGHVFAKTLAEHNINVRRWRQIEQQQGQ